MKGDPFYLNPFIMLTGALPTGDLETRMMKFLESSHETESLDGPAFAQIIGSETKADYLLANRRVIAELKTVNADPQHQIEKRLKERFAQPGAPYVIGRVGIAAVTRKMDDGEDLNKMMVDVAGRAVRRHLRKADTQIAAIKKKLDLPNAGGLLILMNDSEPMIDVAATGYSIMSAFDTVEGGFPNITAIWASVESHKVQLPNGQRGYPQVLMFRSPEREDELNYFRVLLHHWAHVHGAQIAPVDATPGWDSLAAVYDDGAPELSMY